MDEIVRVPVGEAISSRSLRVPRKMATTAKQSTKAIESRAVVERVWTDVVNGGNLAAIDELVAEEYRYHGPGGFELAGPAGFRRFIAALHDIFDGLTIVVHEYIVDGDRVFSRWTGTGTHRDSGQPVEWAGATVTHVADGQIFADWEYWDRLELAEQIATGWLEKRIVDSVSRGSTADLPTE